MIGSLCTRDKRPNTLLVHLQIRQYTLIDCHFGQTADLWTRGIDLARGRHQNPRVHKSAVAQSDSQQVHCYMLLTK